MSVIIMQVVSLEARSFVFQISAIIHKAVLSAFLEMNAPWLKAPFEASDKLWFVDLREIWKKFIAKEFISIKAYSFSDWIFVCQDL